LRAWRPRYTEKRLFLDIFTIHERVVSLNRDAEGALYGTELGSVTLKRVGLFCFPIKHSTHTPHIAVLTSKVTWPTWFHSSLLISKITCPVFQFVIALLEGQSPPRSPHPLLLTILPPPSPPNTVTTVLAQWQVSMANKHWTSLGCDASETPTALSHCLHAATARASRTAGGGGGGGRGEASCGGVGEKTGKRGHEWWGGGGE
jgi:hypothetical protein